MSNQQTILRLIKSGVTGKAALIEASGLESKQVATALAGLVTRRLVGSRMGHRIPGKAGNAPAVYWPIEGTPPPKEPPPPPVCVVQSAIRARPPLQTVWMTA